MVWARMPHSTWLYLLLTQNSDSIPTADNHKTYLTKKPNDRLRPLLAGHATTPSLGDHEGAEENFAAF
jgi:hypothetical protein